MTAPLAAAGAAVGVEALAEAAGAEAGAGETFGGEAAESWGEGGGEERVPDVDSSGEGHQFHIDKETLTDMLHSQEVLDALMAVAFSVRDDCNGIKQIERAEYDAYLQTTPGYVTPQVLVMPSNYVGVVDDAAYSTMLTACGNAEGADVTFVMGFVPETEDPEYPVE